MHLPGALACSDLCIADDHRASEDEITPATIAAHEAFNQHAAIVAGKSERVLACKHGLFFGFQIANQPVKLLAIIRWFIPVTKVTDVFGEHICFAVVLSAREDVIVEANGKQHLRLWARCFMPFSLSKSPSSLLLASALD